MNIAGKKRFEVTSSYYAGFVSSVQSLDRTLAQASDTKADELADKMLDVYISIIFVNDRLDLLEVHASGFLGLDVLKNDFFTLKYSFTSLMRSSLQAKDELDSQKQLKFAKHIHLFLTDLPKEFENSNEFYNQFGRASEHIKPLLHIPFEK